jgi:tetratricopeptide (TPR) repeat protein
MSLPYRDDINNTLSEASRAPSRGLHWTGKSMQEQSSVDSDLARLSLSFSDDENSNKQESGAAWTREMWELRAQSPSGIEARDIWNFLPIKVYPDAEKDPILQPFIISRDGTSITSTANRLQPEDNSEDYSINFELQFTPAFKAFVGRRHELRQIEEYLRPHHEDHGCVYVLCGVGGIGKTFLALEFVRQHRKAYTAVFWIDGSTKETVTQSIENIKGRLPEHQRLEKPGNLNGAPSTERQEAIDDVLTWLCRKGNNRWLMIFDNVDHDAYDVWGYIPKADHGFVLVTTRSRHLVNIGVHLEIPAMNLDQSIDMLDLASGGIIRDCGQLPLILSYHPLALVLAGSFFRQYRITQEKYLELCRQTLDGASNLLSHRSEFSIISTLQVSFNQVRNSNPSAAFLLELWSCLSKTDLWFELLSPTLKEINEIPGWLRSLASDDSSFLDAMQTLLDYSLAECHENGGGYTMQTVIHEFCYDQLRNKQEMTLFATIVLGHAASSTHIQEYWALQRRLLPHIDRTQSLMKRFADFQIPENLSGLMSVCFHKIEDIYADQGQIAEATQAARQAVSCLPVYHPDRAKFLDNLGLRLGYKSPHTRTFLDLVEAVHVTRQAIDITPYDHPDQAGQLANLGRHLFHRYRYPNYTKPITYLKEAIQVTRQAVNATPDDNPDRAERLNNLGTYLFSQYRYTNGMGDLDEVIRVARQAVNATPNNHPDLAERLNNLGLRLCVRYLRTGTMSDLEEATSCHNLALHQLTSNIVVRIEAGRNALITAAEAFNWKQAYEASSIAIKLALELIRYSPEDFDGVHKLSQLSYPASDAVVAALNSQQPPIISLKILEQGLCLVAASTDMMCVDILNLQEADSVLAEKFIAVRHKLQSLTMSERITTQTDRSSWELRADECRKENEKICKLIAEIRDKDGLEDFLDAPSLKEMQAVTVLGPIAVINVSSYRCDAILVEIHQIRVLKLPSLNREEIEAKTESADLGSPEILQWLWDAVTEPILNALGYIDCPSGDKWPRIWWIPTGPLTTFPLHAAGYHDRASGQTVIDRVMSSYSPSIKAMIQSRRSQASSTVKEAVLAASEQPNLLYVTEEVEKIRQLCQAMSLTPVDSSQSKKNIISHLLRCKIFHFVSYGYTNESYLTHNKHLSVTFTNLFELNLRKSPPFLAYLSMWTTDPSYATRTIDQNIGLIRKCQLAGFRHVIGTLWNITETGVNMATIIYEEMRDSNLTDESVCRGLHNASRIFRDRWLTTLETRNGSDRASTRSPSWIPYVHYGV